MSIRTYFALLAEYGTAQIPLEKVAGLFGMTAELAAKRALRQELPVPVFRLGTQKSPWLVDAEKLAHYLDDIKGQAERDWKMVNGQPG